MTEKTDARVIVALSTEFAKAVNENGLQYTNLPELDALKTVLAGEKATLTNVMRDFEYYVQSSDAHGADPSPMIDWSRDATTSDRAKGYYASKFVVTQHAGTKVFPVDVAKRIYDSLKPLQGQGVVDKVRVDSMDPANNPSIPEKYFG